MPKLLIVDDEDEIVEAVSSFFSEEGFDVITADTCESGIRKVKETRPDIVLVDLKLPDSSGLDVLKEAKDFDRAIKVIVETGYVDQFMMDKSDDLGCDKFLLKPFNLEDLKEVVDSFL